MGGIGNVYISHTGERHSVEGRQRQAVEGGPLPVEDRGWNVAVFGNVPGPDSGGNHDQRGKIRVRWHRAVVVHEGCLETQHGLQSIADGRFAGVRRGRSSNHEDGLGQRAFHDEAPGVGPGAHGRTVVGEDQRDSIAGQSRQVARRIVGDRGHGAGLRYRWTHRHAID